MSASRYLNPQDRALADLEVTLPGQSPWAIPEDQPLGLVDAGGPALRRARRIRALVTLLAWPFRLLQSLRPRRRYSGAVRRATRNVILERKL